MLLLTGIELLAPMLHMVVWRSRPLEHIVWSDFVPAHHLLSAAKAGGLHQKTIPVTQRIRGQRRDQME